MCKILERENAEKKLAKSGNCECNCRYTYLSSFRHCRLADRRAKRAREMFGFSLKLA